MYEQMAERPDRFVLSVVDWQTIVDALQDGVGVLDPDGRILACNRSAAAILGRSMSQLVGHTPLEVDLGAVSEDGAPLPLDAYPSAEARRSGKPVWERTIGIHHPDGALRWLSVSATPMGADAQPEAVVLTFRDITDRRDYEAELRRLAEVDELTGLPNRRAWSVELPVAIERARRDQAALSIAMLDLDRFKRFNDEYGHQAGDRLLKTAAAAWSGQLRAVDHLARYGGEEFIVLLPGASTELATMVLERLRSATPAGQTFSAGVATWDGNETSEELIARADQALYQAKDAGRDRIQVATELAPTKVQPSTVSMAPEMT